MYKLFYSVIAFSRLLFAQELDPGHTEQGTEYGTAAVQEYAVSRHGLDGAFFLDPYFLPFLQQMRGLHLLDAGCGAGPWALEAAKHGAWVDGIDIQQAMLDLAKLAVEEAGYQDRIFLRLGDVASLPYEDNLFDCAVSINVGCNLPTTTSSLPHVGLQEHLKEMYRVLRPGGEAILTAPASLGTVFANKAYPNEAVMGHIQHVLRQVGNSQDVSLITQYLNELTEVFRATFYRKNGELHLVEDENELSLGEEIWRKLPTLTVPNRYHSEKEYIEAVTQAGFVIKAIHRPKFETEEQWTESATSLGKSYCEHHPFIIFHLEKSK
jgi:SAM-dependent methyltransferase